MVLPKSMVKMNQNDPIFIIHTILLIPMKSHDSCVGGEHEGVCIETYGGYYHNYTRYQIQHATPQNLTFEDFGLPHGSTVSSDSMATEARNDLPSNPAKFSRFGADKSKTLGDRWQGGRPPGTTGGSKDIEISRNFMRFFAAFWQDFATIHSILSSKLKHY